MEAPTQQVGRKTSNLAFQFAWSLFGASCLVLVLFSAHVVYWSGKRLFSIYLPEPSLNRSEIEVETVEISKGKMSGVYIRGKVGSESIAFTAPTSCRSISAGERAEISWREDLRHPIKGLREVDILRQGGIDICRPFASSSYWERLKFMYALFIVAFSAAFALGIKGILQFAPSKAKTEAAE
jgi:hypothetical protein